MPSLSDRLKSLGVTFGPDKPLSEPVPDEGENRPIEAVISGTNFQTEYGSTFITIKEFDADYVHGDFKLHGKHPLDLLSDWSQTPRLSQLDLTQIAFLDTETSGLSGGTGTYAFLIGLGFFTPSSFKVIQFFMRDPSEESALLTALTEWLIPFQAIVTFNGKSFDLPLLKTRYFMNGLETPFLPLDHIDLLHLARRIWRNRLESRALGDLEKEIVGFYRDQEEVPGFLIPQIFFDYMRTRNAGPLAGVFYHNVYDLVTLAALFGFLADLLDHPTEDILPALDVIAIAKLYEDLGKYELAASLYETGLSQGLPGDFLISTLERFARLRRRQGLIDESMALWLKAANYGHLLAFVEISKYHEHQMRNHRAALDWSKQGLEAIKNVKMPKYQAQIWSNEFLHRIQRLENKLSKDKDRGS